MAAQKALWRLTFRAPLEDEEALNERLYAITGSYPATEQRPGSKTARFEAYFKNRSQLHAAEQWLKDHNPKASVLPYENWAESWKKHFPILRIGKRILIKPSWRTYSPRDGEIVIELDPGMSFGTGQHATTRFCLQMIERLFASRFAFHTPRSLLDVGTGSGILAIAAAKLGFDPILAVDNDQGAVRVAKQNTKHNGVRLPIDVQPLEAISASRKYNVVTANLLADLIIAHRRKLASLTAPGGYLILAGILSNEARQVERAFRPLGFTTWACESRGTWAGFVFRKPAARKTNSRAR